MILDEICDEVLAEAATETASTTPCSFETYLWSEAPGDFSSHGAICRNEPVGQWDPFGLFPTKQEAAGLDEYMAWVEETIANAPTVRAAFEAIEARHDREHSISPSAKSYLYSPDFWWLDMKHVIAGASKAYRSGFLSSWLWGIAVEAEQAETAADYLLEWQFTRTWTQPIRSCAERIAVQPPRGRVVRYLLRDPVYRAQSAWSSEDLLSNYIGAFFGAYVLQESDTPKTLASKLKTFLAKLGVGAKPSDDSSAMTVLPQDVASWIGTWTSDPLVGVVPYADVHKFFQRGAREGESPSAYFRRDPDVSLGAQEFRYYFDLYLESKASIGAERRRVIEREMKLHMDWARRHYEK